MSTKNLVILDRSAALDKLKNEVFDLLVIGGGATGCGIALDAASRGLKTALVEKRDFASGTSSKSTKLIHGGLRYLKQLEFGLVHETGTERAIVHRLAPHLVLPEKMLLPFVDGGTFGYYSTSLALKVYDVLAGVEKKDQRKMLTKEEALDLEPLLDEATLKGGGFYAEYRTDDARLTIELIKSAARYGTTPINYVQANTFNYNGDQIESVDCQDNLSGEPFIIKATQVVSAAGPWVDKLRKEDKSLKGKRLHLTKGVHIVVPHETFPLQHTIYFDVEDGRMIFAIPRGRVTYIGTTDTTYTGSMDRIVVTKADAEYLLNAVNKAFPSIHLNMENIESNWAGLRPLIHEDGKSPSELSRKDEIFNSPSGLISIAGGKLTGYRKMAERVVDLVVDKFNDTGNKFPKSKTKKIPLTIGALENAEAVELYIKQLEKKLSPYQAWYLVTNYGTQAELVLEKMKSFDDEPVIALARAEAWFTVTFEMVNSAEDFFVRRTGRLYFNIPSIKLIRKIVMKDLKDYLGWNAKRLKTENENLDELIHDATHYYEKELI